MELVYTQCDNATYKRYGKGILFSNGMALNETASDIFDLCDGAHSLNAIVDCLYEMYDCDKAKLTCDVQECLSYMLEQHLITQVQSTP